MNKLCRKHLHISARFYLQLLQPKMPFIIIIHSGRRHLRHFRIVVVKLFGDDLFLVCRYQALT